MLIGMVLNPKPLKKSALPSLSFETLSNAAPGSQTDMCLSVKPQRGEEND
jgi:hypothetical protein|uniref:Uncharacterized protein n=1 Tax=Zea mays TaxID=4577 RepID=C0PLP0_MAIZE|nr:unknown [Zea mays]